MGAGNSEEDGEQEWKLSLSRGHKKKLKVKATKIDALSMFRAIEPEGVNAIGDKDGWEFIEFALDSGATETVVGEEMLSSMETKEGAAKKGGPVCDGNLVSREMPLYSAPTPRQCADRTYVAPAPRNSTENKPKAFGRFICKP